MHISIALKKPNGTRYGWMNVTNIDDHFFDFFDEDCTKEWQHSEDINEWISLIFKDFLWEDYVLYNDDPYETGSKEDKEKEEKGEKDKEKEKDNKKAFSTGGHAKGILVWNKKTIKWLIHSVPNYPQGFPITRKIEDGQLIYGQSFVAISIDYSFEILENIFSQLSHMKAHIYQLSSITLQIVDKREIDTTVTTLSFADKIVHVSKGVKWGKDLYDDFFSIFVGKDEICADSNKKEKILCETWVKPGLPSSSFVKNIRMVKWNDDLNTEYFCTQDHSKYAVSMNPSRPWVMIGDINRMESQFRRGGGGLMICNKRVWRAFQSILYNYTDIVDNPLREQGCLGFKC